MGYAAQISTALKLITQFGKSVTLTREDDGATYNPVTGTMSGGSTTSLTGVGVFLNYQNIEINDDIKTTDRKMIYQGDALLIGDKYGTARIYALSNLDPDESGAIITTAQIRQ